MGRRYAAFEATDPRLGDFLGDGLEYGGLHGRDNLEAVLLQHRPHDAQPQVALHEDGRVLVIFALSVAQLVVAHEVPLLFPRRFDLPSGALAEVSLHDW